MKDFSIFSQRRMFETRKKKKGNQRPCWFLSNMPSPPSPLENLFPFGPTYKVQSTRTQTPHPEFQITPTPSRPPPSSHKTSPTKQLAASARTAKQLWLVASCPLIPLCPTIIARQSPANPSCRAGRRRLARLAFPCLN